MILSRPMGLLVIVAAFLVLGCQSGSNSNKEKNKNEVVPRRVEITDGWARPGSKGQASAAYLTVTNGTGTVDTLTSAHSPAAEKAQLHRSTTNDQGISTMRPVGKQQIMAGEELQLSPGGYHLMLMNLQRDLAVGDSALVTLTFAHADKQQLKIPVKL